MEQLLPRVNLKAICKIVQIRIFLEGKAKNSGTAVWEPGRDAENDGHENAGHEIDGPDDRT